MSEPLTILFAALHRGPVQRTWRIETPWQAFGGLPEDMGALVLELEVRGSPRDGVRATGRARTDVLCECRRCLADIRAPIEVTIDAWFRAPDEVTPGEDGVWAFGADSGEIDLAPAVREELLLGLPDYPVCEDACAGLCPMCGVRLADEACTCPPPGPDPRWAALRALDKGDRGPEGDPA